MMIMMMKGKSDSICTPVNMKKEGGLGKQLWFKDLVNYLSNSYHVPDWFPFNRKEKK